MTLVSKLSSKTQKVLENRRVVDFISPIPKANKRKQNADQGKLVLDQGAVKVLKISGKSLLAVGVKSASGEFNRSGNIYNYSGDCITIRTNDVNFSCNGNIIDGVESGTVAEYENSSVSCGNDIPT